MVWAISSGLPTRWSGTPAIKLAFLSSVPVNRVSMPVSIGPGATALTRTPAPAASSLATPAASRAQAPLTPVVIQPRASGYFGVTNYLGSKFVASPAAIGAFESNLRQRGLAFIDDGSAARVGEPWLGASINDRYENWYIWQPQYSIHLSRADPAVWFAILTWEIRTGSSPNGASIT